jgi:HK97 family phage portal protein
MVAHCLTHGNAYALKSKNGAGVVTEVRAVHPSKVRVVSGKKTELNPEGRWFIVRSNDGESTYSPSEMFELPYLAIDGSVGVSPLAVARRSLGIGLSAEQTSSQFYRRGARPLGFLKSKKSLTDENATRLQSRFESRTSGADNAGKVVVLDNDTEWQGISMPPIDAQLLESRKFTATEIARLFGIPPHLLGDVEKSSSWGTGIEQQMTGFVQFSLLPWLTLIQQRVTRDLLPGGWTAGSWYAEFVVEGLLRGDSAARAQFYASGITNGWFSRNEARSRENLDPREGLDELLVPSNLTLVSVDGSLVPLSSTGVNAQQP